MSAPQRKPLIAGHSHIMAMGLSLSTTDGATAIVDTIDYRFGGLSGTWPRDRAYFDELVKLARDRTVFLVWMGNQHLADYLFKPDDPFDFVIAGREDLPLDTSVDLIPEAVVRDYFDFEDLDDVLSRLRDQPGCRTILCGTPPPKPDNDFLRKLMAKEAAWASLATVRGLDPKRIPLSSPMLRLKLWLVMQDLFAEAAAKAYLEFAPVPDEAFDKDGYLAEEFWGVDATHAWARYGDVVREYWYNRYLMQAL